MEIKFWVDPICPWCWMTARWVVDLVQPERDLTVVWQPISLLFKNKPEPGSEWHEPTTRTHGLLRVMESVRAAEGNEGVTKFYWAAGTLIHHDSETTLSAQDVLSAAGLDLSHASAFDDETFDATIEESMERAFALVGTDVGTPIIEFPTKSGGTAGIFGPVISKLPPKEDALALWDAMETLATMDDFWELKRSRSVRPTLPERPDLSG